MKLIVLTAVVALLGMPAVSAGAPLPYDLNGDGRQELVVGLPGWHAGKRTLRKAHAVAVLPGSQSRLVGRPRMITEEALGVERESRGVFGRAVASADFDGDGSIDLAVGSTAGGEPPADRPDEVGPGRVLVLYGPLSPAPSRVELVDGAWGDEDPWPPSFGGELVAGVLDGDRFGDLVVGQLTEPGVHVLFGAAGGLGSGERRVFERPIAPPITYGGTFAVGDPDADGDLDLVEAEIGETVSYGDGDRPRRGYVTVAEGTPDGPGPPQPFRRLKGGPTSLAFGDVTGDGYDDLVAGVARNRVVRPGGRLSPGAVKIWRGGPDGLSGRPIVVTQDTGAIPGRNQPGDLFGNSVAVARLDRDRYADIVVGAPGEDGDTGRVTVIRGGPRGYARRGHRAFIPGERGVPGGRKTWEFGAHVTLLDHDGDGRLDLSASERTGEGGVIVLAGATRGFFTTSRTRRFKVARLGICQRDISEMELGRVASSE